MPEEAAGVLEQVATVKKNEAEGAQLGLGVKAAALGFLDGLLITGAGAVGGHLAEIANVVPAPVAEMARNAAALVAEHPEVGIGIMAGVVVAIGKWSVDRLAHRYPDVQKAVREAKEAEQRAKDLGKNFTGDPGDKKMNQWEMASGVRSDQLNRLVTQVVQKAGSVK